MTRVILNSVQYVILKLFFLTLQSKHPSPALAIRQRKKTIWVPTVNCFKIILVEQYVYDLFVFLCVDF